MRPARFYYLALTKKINKKDFIILYIMLYLGPISF